MLFAVEKHAGMTELIARKFSGTGDVEQVTQLSHVGGSEVYGYHTSIGFGFVCPLRICDFAI